MFQSHYDNGCFLNRTVCKWAIISVSLAFITPLSVQNSILDDGDKLEASHLHTTIEQKNLTYMTIAFVNIEAQIW